MRARKRTAPRWSRRRSIVRQGGRAGRGRRDDDDI